jgi:hypothetical protein
MRILPTDIVNLRDRRVGGLSHFRDAIFFAVLAAICILTIFAGFPAPLGSYGHDSLFFLDNAYRVLQGQVPYKDFSSAFGPLIFQIHASGLAVSNLAPEGLAYANAIWGLSIAVWTALIARSRFSYPAPYLIGVYALCLIVAPFPLGSNPFDFGFAMTYNRYGFALLGIVVLECGALLFTDNMSTQKCGAVSTGVALGMLAFLKITYVFAGVPFVMFSLALADRTIRLARAIRIVCSFLLVALVFLVYLKFSIPEMMEDLSNAAFSRRLTLNLFVPVTFFDFSAGSLLLVLSLLIYGSRKSSDPGEHAAPAAVIFAIFSIAAGYLTLVTNNQVSSFPLNGYAAIVLIESYRRSEGIAGLAKLPIGLSNSFPGKLLGSVCIVPLCLLSIAALLTASSSQLRNKAAPGAGIELPARGGRLVFRNFEVDTETTGLPYVMAVKDGLALLERNSTGHEGILVLDEFNPFNYLLGRHPPRGGISAAAYAYTFHEKAHPSALRFFGDAPIVLVRKYRKSVDQWERQDVRALLHIYGEALESDFALIEQTDHWELWRRKDAESQLLKSR